MARKVLMLTLVVMLTILGLQNSKSEVANTAKLEIMGTLLKKSGEVTIKKTSETFCFEAIWAIPEYLALNPKLGYPTNHRSLSKEDQAEKLIFLIAGRLEEETFSLWDFWHSFSLQVEDRVFKPESFQDWVRASGTAYFSESIFDYVGRGYLYVNGWLLFSKEARDAISQNAEKIELKYHGKQLEWSPKKIYTVIGTL